MKKIILFSLFLTGLAFAEGGPDPKVVVFKAKLLQAKPLKLAFTPPRLHHFNQEAPSKVEMLINDKSVGVAQITKSLQQMTADFSVASEPGKSCQVIAQLYLCDDKNTYCVPIKEEFTCDKLGEGKVLGLKTEEQNTKEALESKTSEIKNFLVNDKAKAFEAASTGKKLLLIDFFGIWCPPCNMLDETVFNRPEFQAMNKNFVFAKMDADKPENFQLKSKYDIKGYPTVILADSEGNEISRVVGYRKKSSFIKEMRKALNFRDLNTEAGIQKASSGKYPDLALAMADASFNKEDFNTALKFIGLSGGAKNTITFRRVFIGTQVGLLKESSKDEATKKKALDLVSFWVNANRDLVDSLEWAGYLAQLAGDLKDDKLKANAKNLQISIGQGFLDSLKKNPKILDEEEITEADLNAILGDAYEETDKVKSQDYFLKAALAYETEIKKSGLAIDTERGNNIERAYCLYKAGKTAESMKLYEQLEKVYPSEFTFFYNHASVLQKLGQEQSALEKGKIALQFSYGDNQLRAAYLVAELESKLGQKKEALNLVTEVLEKNPVDKSLKVRTSRYIDKLIELKSQL